MDFNNKPVTKYFKPEFSKEEFIRIVAQGLANNNFDKNAIDCLDPAKVRLVYGHAYIFKGTAEGSYNCELANDLEVTINKNKNNLKAGTPMSGNVLPLKFHCATPVFYTNLQNWIKPFYGHVVYSNVLQDYHEGDIDSSAILPIGDGLLSPEEFWMKNGNVVVDNMFHDTIEDMYSDMAIVYLNLGLVSHDEAMQLSNMGMKSNISCKNWNIMLRNNVEEYGEHALLPYYVMEFEYNNQNYFIVSNGFKDVCLYNIPKSQDTNPTPEQQAEAEHPDEAKKIKLMKWGWALAVVVLFILGFIAAIVTLAAWYGLYWYMKRKFNAYVTEIQENRNASNNTLAKLIAQKLGV